ncbi:MAG TPA: glycosyltransferase [Blastocatellia bacterium]|nr:glycosyltransferase [Blastocatellia bacterium]
MTEVSVVVIARNEEAHIGKCLRAILEAVAEIGGAEVVVADSASTDRTVEIAQSFGARVIGLRPEWELSPSAGRYIGFHHTSGRLVMFVDADTVIDRQWFPAAIRAFEQPDVAAVTGWLDDVDEEGRSLPYVGRRSGQTVVISYLRGIGLYRRAALEEVGAFNPYLITEEEAELALRLRARGWKLLQLPQQMGRHERGAELQAGILRALRLGRVRGTGKTLRYAWQSGQGLRFCRERLLQTIFFVVMMLALVSLGAGLRLAGIERSAWIVLALLAGWLGAVALRKKSLQAPFDYLTRHALISYGVIAGLITTRLQSPQDYPRDVIEQNVSPVRQHHESEHLTHLCR